MIAYGVFAGMNAPSFPLPRFWFDRGTLLLQGVDRAPAPWTWDARVSAWRCDAIHCEQVRSGLPGMCEDRVRDPRPLEWPRVLLPTFRPEQTRALAAWHAADGRGVVVMPPGTGKTEVALAAMAATKTPALIVVPLRALIPQWQSRIARALGCEAAVLGAGRLDPRAATIATYESAYARMPEVGDRFGLLVFDEVHHLPGRCFREAALASTAALRLGLTATLDRADGLDALVGPVIFRLGFREARGSSLPDYRVVRVPIELTRQERSRYAGAGRLVRTWLHARQTKVPGYAWRNVIADSARDPAARRVLRAFRARRAIEEQAEGKLSALAEVLRLHAPDRVLVFTGSNEMAMEASRRLLVPAVLAHTGVAERRAVIEGISSGRFRAVVAHRVLDEGVDLPHVRVAIVLGGCASTRQAQQRLGRILRKSGDVSSTLYEVVCARTGEEARSRDRRRSDAYPRPGHRSL